MVDFSKLCLQTNTKPRTIKDLGVIEFKPRSNCETTFLMAPAEDQKNITGFVGPEFEGTFSNGCKSIREVIHKLKDVKKAILENKVANTNYNEYSRNWADTIERLPSIAQIYTCTKYLLHTSSPLIYDVPHEDGGGIECVLKPATLKAHHILKPEYERILNLYKELGFTDELPGAGLHIYIDDSLFGSTTEQINNNYTHFLWFLFKHQDEMLTISQRKYSSQLNADMYSMLGNTLGNMSDEEYEKAFKNSKASILEALKSPRKEYKRYLNISIHRDQRPASEFRWFSSTMNITIFMSFIEFGFAVPAWTHTLSDESQVSFISFCNFIKQNVSTYPHIFDYFCSLPEIQGYMNLESMLPPEQLDLRPIEQQRRRVERIELAYAD